MKKTLAFDCSARSVESSIYTIILESESDEYEGRAGLLVNYLLKYTKCKSRAAIFEVGICECFV